MSNVPHVNVNIWGKGVWNCQCVQTLKYKQKIHVWYKYKQKCMSKIPYSPYAPCFHVRVALKPPQKSVRWRYARERFFPRLCRNRLTIIAITHTFLERSFTAVQHGVKITEEFENS